MKAAPGSRDGRRPLHSARSAIQYGLLGLFALLASACASDAHEPEGLRDAAIDEGASPADVVTEDTQAEALPNPLIDELCPGACAAAVECDETVKTDACLEQCGKEIEGDGYLIPEVAKQLFELINEDENEDEGRCGRMRGFWYWRLNPWVDGVEVEVERPEELSPCVERYELCGGPDMETTCWIRYYRYNYPVRAPILECLQAPCSATWADCIYDHEPQGQPWLTIPATIWD